MTITGCTNVYKSPELAVKHSSSSPEVDKVLKTVKKGNFAVVFFYSQSEDKNSVGLAKVYKKKAGWYSDFKISGPVIGEDQNDHDYSYTRIKNLYVFYGIVQDNVKVLNDQNKQVKTVPLNTKNYNLWYVINKNKKFNPQFK